MVKCIQWGTRDMNQEQKERKTAKLLEQLQIIVWKLERLQSEELK